MNKINVLISAHEFSPYQGSECAVGWNLIMNLAKNKDLNLFVLFAEGSSVAPFLYVDAVNSYIIEFGIPSNVNLIPIGQPKSTIAIYRLNISIFKKMGAIGFPLLHYLGYTIWQKKAFRVAKNVLKNNSIDIAHHLTQISFREPGYLWKLGIPFVWGPVGGIENLPSTILRELPFGVRVFEMIRNTSNFYQFNFKIRIRKALKIAKQIFVISNEDLIKISKVNSNVTSLLDSATTIDEDVVVRNLKEGEKLKIIWAGHLAARKSLDVLIKALATIKDVNNRVEVTVLGDGELMECYLNLVKKLSLDCFNFIGRVEHNEVKSYLLKSHILVHTSYREATSVIIPEALSTGLPIMCHDISGMAIAVTDTCGIKIPLHSFKSSTIEFGNSIKKILKEPTLIKQLSNGAILRRNDLTWEKSANKISDCYKKIVSEKNQI